MEIPGENSFKKLLASLLFGSFIETYKRTPSILLSWGRITKLAKLKSDLQLICADIDRVLSEMDIAISLFSNIPSDESLQRLGTTKPKYYVFLMGIFLNLTHQIKDKLFRLIYTLNDIYCYNGPAYKAQKIKAPTLGKIKKLPVAKMLPIQNELDEWEDESDSIIGGALRYRTHHHHGISKMPLNKDLQTVDFEKIARTPEFQKHITEKGQKEIESISQAAFTKWHEENFENIKKVRASIIDNLTRLSDIILKSEIDIPKSMDGFIKEFPEWFIKANTPPQPN
jgi:hypothetical protein